MKRFLKHQFFWRKSSRIHLGIPLVATTLIMISMVVILLSNTYSLERSLEEYAETYSEDVSEQLAARIAFRLKQRAHDMKNLAGSFSKMPEKIVTETLLKQKQELLDVTNLFILTEDGNTFPEIEQIDGLSDYLEQESGIEKETHISFLAQNQVIFSTPFYKEDKLHLLIATCTGQTLQEMLEDFNYKEEGRCCLVDKKGNVIIAPSNMQPFLTLKQFFKDPSSVPKNESTISDMLDHIKNESSGWTVFHDLNKQDFIVGYNFLGVCDWMLFTILPHDLLSNKVKIYTIKFTLVALALILVTIGIIILMLRIYQKNIHHIKEAALTDSLTNGHNDTAFRIHGEYLLKEYPEQKRAIIYINNKNFKGYNERFGINGANKILCTIYQILMQHRCHHELVSRCDGTSFCCLLEYTDKSMINTRLEMIASEICQKLHDYYSIDHHRIFMGAYLIPEEPDDFIHMLDWAKIASTYHTESETCKIFDESIVTILRREAELDAAFEHAIEHHEFKLYIQPKISPKDQKLCGGEILVRWEHPEYGLIPPNEFIPLFEKNGKICSLDFYMFEETCKLLKEWIQKGQAIPLSVNLSRAHLGSHNFDFLNYFRTVKEHYQIPDGLIELELTESIILERQEVSFVLKVMDRIRSMGFECSLDDFGYGYSSLTLLKDLNVNTIKLDRLFFLNESERSWIVVGELIHMAHQLQLRVVAEGIEEQEQVQKLKEYHCDLIQGYIYAKPMAIPVFINWASNTNL